MVNYTEKVKIIADYREKPSGIPDLLLDRDVDIELRQLKSGDYFINQTILVERKTDVDFVQTLVSNRLFLQCHKMKRNIEYPLFIIEGNPYKTQYNISTQAIKGAILSISVAWQIPVFFTNDKLETIDVLIMAGKQVLQDRSPVLRTGYKPKKNKGRKLYFIQGLPSVGPVMAQRLMERFKSIDQIINASQEELLEVEGMGNEKAKKIIEFIEGKI